MGQEGVTGVRPIVEVVAAPIVNYAMAHGGIAFLHRIVVTVPPTAGDVDDLRRPRRGRGRPGRRPDPPVAAPRRQPARGHTPRRRPSRDPPRRPVPRRARGGDDRRGRRHRHRGRPGARPRLHPGPGARRSAVVARPGRAGALARAAGVVRPAQPSRRRAHRRPGRGDPRRPDEERQPPGHLRRPRARRRDRRRGVHGGPRARRLLRRAAGQLGLRPEGPDARRRVRAAGRHLPRHDDRPRVMPGARRHHPGPLGGPRARLPRLLAPRRAGPARRRQPPDRSRGERRRPRPHGCRRDDHGHPRAPPAQGPLPAGRPGAQGRVLPRRLLRAGRGGRRRDGPADAGPAGPRPPRPRRRRGRAGRVHARRTRWRADRHRGDPHTGAVVRTRPATAATRRATAGPGLEERPARPHPAQPAAQPRRPDDAGAAGHAERAARPPRADPPGGEDGLGPRGRRPGRRRRRGPQPRRLLAARRRPARHARQPVDHLLGVCVGRPQGGDDPAALPRADGDPGDRRQPALRHARPARLAARRPRPQRAAAARAGAGQGRGACRSGSRSTTRARSR